MLSRAILSLALFFSLAAVITAQSSTTTVEFSCSDFQKAFYTNKFLALNNNLPPAYQMSNYTIPLNQRNFLTNGCNAALSYDSSSPSRTCLHDDSDNRRLLVEEQSIKNTKNRTLDVTSVNDSDINQHLSFIAVALLYAQTHFQYMNCSDINNYIKPFCTDALNKLWLANADSKFSHVQNVTPLTDNSSDRNDYCNTFGVNVFSQAVYVMLKIQDGTECEVDNS